jgi:hypothetical protein
LKWVQAFTITSPGGLTPNEAKALQKELKDREEEITILKKVLGLLTKK